MPLGSLPTLLAASPALVAMLLIPFVGGALQATVVQTAAYISYQAAEPKSAVDQRQQTASRRRISLRRPLALAALRAARAAGDTWRAGAASALHSLFLPFPNAPRAP